MVSLTGTGRRISSYVKCNNNSQQGQARSRKEQEAAMRLPTSSTRCTMKKRMKMKRGQRIFQQQVGSISSGQLSASSSASSGSLSKRAASSLAAPVSPATLLACYEDSAFIYRRPPQHQALRRSLLVSSHSLSSPASSTATSVSSSSSSTSSSSSLRSFLESSSFSSACSSSFGQTEEPHPQMDCISALDFFHLSCNSSSSSFSLNPASSIRSSSGSRNGSAKASPFPLTQRQLSLNQQMGATSSTASPFSSTRMSGRENINNLQQELELEQASSRDNPQQSRCREKGDAEKLTCHEGSLSSMQEPQADPVYLEDGRVFENLIMKENAELKRRAHLRGKCVAGENRLLLRGERRHSLLSWMLSVCEQQLCQDEIFPLASMILDKFLLSRPLTGVAEQEQEQAELEEREATGHSKLIERQLYLFGACSLLLASKLRQTPRLCIGSLLALSEPELGGQALCKEELLEGELLVLSVLRWDLVALVTPNDFLGLLLSKCKSLHSQVSGQQRLRRHTQTLVELCLMDTNLSQSPPSIMAMASLAVAIDGLSTTEKTCRRLEDIVTRIYEATHKVNELKLMIDVAFQIEKYVQKLLNSTHNMIE